MTGILHRRSFLKHMALGAAGLGTCPDRLAAISPATFRNRKTRHLILIVNGGGARKKDYYEDVSIAPNMRRLAAEGFVFEEDHCDQIASHARAFWALMHGHALYPSGSPTIIDYIQRAYGDEPSKYWLVHENFSQIPAIMREFKPRVLILRQQSHDAGHGGYDGYLHTIRATDKIIGHIFNWVKNDPYFSKNTAIVIRPEFGRDDVVTGCGELHHSEGFYYTHRVASIYWGPDFNVGVDSQTVVNAYDLAPTLAAVFDVAAPYAEGRVVPGLFRPYDFGFSAGAAGGAGVVSTISSALTLNLSNTSLPTTFTAGLSDVFK